jgi:hypothetical protein
VNINVSADIKRLTKHLDDIQRRQIPFATARALTITAKHAQAAITAQLPSIFDAKGAPTPFTLRAIASTPARKADLTATVFVRPMQARYLELEETGGQRTSATGKALPEPIAIGTNAYGNIPRKKIAQLAAKPGYFVGTVKGVAGLYQRPKNRNQPLKLLARFVTGWAIKAKFGFAARVTKDVRQTLPGAMKAAIDKALSTAK